MKDGNGANTAPKAKKAKSANTLSTEDQKRFGVSKPVNSFELNRIRSAQQNRADIQRAGGAYNSPYDTSIGGAETAGYNDTTQTLNTPTVGGGGGGPSALDRYTQAIQGMLTGGSYRKPQDDLLAKLTQMYTQAQPQVNTAMNDLSSFLGAQTNPYAGLQAQQVQATPQLSELLQSQGVNQTPLEQLAAVTQAQNEGQATAYNNLIGSMRDMWQGNQTGQLADVNTQRADLQSQLQNSLLGAGSQLNTKAASQQQDLMTMLLSALAKGGKPKKGRLL
jgi:hypothetical protein